MTTRAMTILVSRAAVAVLSLLVAGCAAPSPSAPPTQTAAMSPSPSPTASPAAAKVVCDTNTSTWTTTNAAGSEVPLAITLTCEKAVAASKAVVPPDLAPVLIEFHFGRYCPPGMRCPAPLPNRGFVIFRTDGSRADLLVSVSADAAGVVTVLAVGPFPSPAGG